MTLVKTGPVTLLLRSGSKTSEPTDAELLRVIPAAIGLTVMITDWVSPELKVPRLHTIGVAPVQPPTLAETN